MRAGRPRRAWLLAVVSGLALLATLVVVPVPTSTAAERVVTLPATAVTYTDLLHPRTAFAAEPVARVSRTLYRTYLKFDTSGLPRSARVVSASLVLTIGSSGGSRPGLDVRYASSVWEPGSLTHDTRPESGPTNLTASSDQVPAAGSTLDLPLEDHSGVAARSAVAFSLAYRSPLTEVEISKQTPPTLAVTLAAPPRSRTQVPYDVAKPGSASKKVFAHYMPTYPISFDNRPPDSDYYAVNYLRPEGENGKHAAVGGFTRDRPLGRDPLDGDWQLADAMTEVQQASAAGIDGFTVNLMGFSGPTWDRSLRIAEAAGRSGTGFVTVPNLDLTSSVADAPVSTVAANLARFYSEPSAYRLPDGRLMLSSFRAESKSVEWWQSLIGTLASSYGIRVAFVGVMLDLTPARIEQYAPISYALGNWGVRTAYAVSNAPRLAGLVRAAGSRWLAPVALQDVRHVGMLYAEAGNTETLRASWDRAMADQAELVQLVTWNDYAESTQLAPSMAHGSSFLDVDGYYLTRFKTGQDPTLLGDELVVTHRVQRFGDQPTQQSGSMSPTLSGNAVPPRDTVEVVSMLSAPATVTLSSGGSSATFDAPAGLSAHLMPLEVGPVAASAVREGETVASVTSPYPVVASPTRWDLQYYGASSRGR